jgi:two-component system sensor histidine kinase YesM
MENTDDEKEYFLAKMRLFNKVNSDITLYKSVSSMFIYSVKNKDFFVIDRETSTIDEKQKIKDYITSVCPWDNYNDESNPKNWHTKSINQTYIFRILKMGDTYMGAWVKARSLLVPLNMIDIGTNGISLLTTDKGEPMTEAPIIRDNGINLKLDFGRYYLMGEKYKYLIVGKESRKGDYNLIALIPDDKILEKLPYLQRINTLISLFFIGLLPLSLFLLRKVLLVPLKHIMATMKRIKDGNLDARIKQHKTSEEFQIVNDTFNNMMTQIKELKINVYEEKINRQKAELEHLQLQINPHFFLNCLNMLYNMAWAKNFELIIEMTMSLVQYFRYMFRSNIMFVSLKDELQHVTNYLRIQKLRFPDCLSYEINAPAFLQDTPIPSLIIHTFVENSIKYAVSLDEPVKLSICIEFEGDEENRSFIKIVIADTGKGFDDNVLVKLNTGGRIIDEQGEHIGIWNVQRRLQLLYNGKTNTTFRNGTNGGAIVEIVLPLKPDKWEMKENDV